MIFPNPNDKEIYYSDVLALDISGPRVRDANAVFNVVLSEYPNLDPDAGLV